MNVAEGLFDESPNYRWWALGAVMLGLFLPVLDTTIVNVALPNMVGSLDTDIDEVRWVISAYAMSFAVITLASAWGRSLVGAKKLYLFSTFLFTLSSFFCGLSPNLNAMIFFRVIQAIGGGLMMPLGFTIITEAFTPADRSKAFGFFGIVIVLAPTIGPILGGYLIDNFNWRDIFFVNIPVGILSFFVTFLILRNDPPAKVLPFDYAGFISLGMTLAFLQMGITEGERWGWDSRFVYECWTVMSISFWVYVYTAFSVKHPILDLSIFRNWDFSLVILLSLTRAISLFGRMFLLPLFVQSYNRFPSIDAGVVLLPTSLMAGIFMPIMGILSSRSTDRGKRIILFAGFALLGLSQMFFTFLTNVPSFYQLLFPQLLFGLSMGLINALLSSLPQNLVEPRHIGLASMLQSNTLQLGGAVGVAILGNILDHRTASFVDQYRSHDILSAYPMQKTLAQIHLEAHHGLLINESGSGVANGLLSQMIHMQASISAYNNTFLYAGLFGLLGIPIIFLMKRFTHESLAGKPTDKSTMGGFAE